MTTLDKIIRVITSLYQKNANKSRAGRNRKINLFIDKLTQFEEKPVLLLNQYYQYINSADFLELA